MNELLEFANLQIFTIVILHLFFALRPGHPTTRQLSWYTLGILLINLIINIILKTIIKQPRPVGHPVWANDYGMPSGHAQFIGFYIPYLIMVYIVWGDFNKGTKWFLGCCAVGFGVVIVWSRVYLNYHTVTQVLVGLGIGIINSCPALFVVFSIFMITEIIRRTL